MLRPCGDEPLEPCDGGATAAVAGASSPIPLAAFQSVEALRRTLEKPHRSSRLLSVHIAASGLVAGFEKRSARDAFNAKIGALGAAWCCKAGGVAVPFVVSPYQDTRE